MVKVFLTMNETVNVNVRDVNLRKTTEAINAFLSSLQCLNRDLCLVCTIHASLLKQSCLDGFLDSELKALYCNMFPLICMHHTL